MHSEDAFARAGYLHQNRLRVAVPALPFVITDNEGSPFGLILAPLTVS